MIQQEIQAEFSRLFRADKAKKTGQFINIEADEAECKALTERFGVRALLELSASFEIRAWKKNGVRVKGTVKARLEQICVVTLDPFETVIEQQVERLFEVASDQSGQVLAGEFDIDMDVDIPDRIIDGNIDLGEIASETVALEINPHPRKADAVFESRYKGDDPLQDEPQRDNPFAVLKNMQKH